LQIRLVVAVASTTALFLEITFSTLPTPSLPIALVKEITLALALETLFPLRLQPTTLYPKELILGLPQKLPQKLTLAP
jgi:hypothetical protein